MAEQFPERQGAVTDTREDVVNPRFGETVVCSAWGIHSGQWTVDQFVALCVQHGVKGICHQIIPENDDHGPALHDAARKAGLHFGGWTNVPQQVSDDATMTELCDRIDLYKAGFFAANIEERWSWGGLPANSNYCHQAFSAQFRKRFKTKPACVQSTAGGFELLNQQGVVVPGYDEKAAELYWRKSFDWQFEAYMCDVPNASPLEGDFIGHNKLGWPAPMSTMIGVYHGWSVADYRQPLLASNRSRVQWVYLPEEMTDADWQMIGQPL